MRSARLYRLVQGIKRVLNELKTFEQFDRVDVEGRQVANPMVELVDVSMGGFEGLMSLHRADCLGIIDK